MPSVIICPRALSWREIARIVAPQNSIQGAWLRFKFLARAWKYRRWTRPWFEFLQTPQMASIARRHSHLFLKVQWPYLHRACTPSRRLEILENHYRVARTRLSPELLHQIFFSPHVTLARWRVEADEVFALRLAFTDYHRQEGEIALELVHEGLERACAFVHFTFTAPGEISIGCLQGSRPVDQPGQVSNQELHRAFKKKMHGLRHKSLLLFALRRLAACWQMNKIRAVGNATQLWSDQLRADYDTFWIEEGGTPTPDGMFSLPVNEGLEDLHARPNKRSMYRRRRQLLESIAAEMEQALEDAAGERDVLDVSLLAPAEPHPAANAPT